METNTQAIPMPEKALQSVSSVYGTDAHVVKTFTIFEGGEEYTRTIIPDVRIGLVVRGYVDNMIIRVVQDATRINAADKEDLRATKRARREALVALFEERKKEVTVTAIMRAAGKDPDKEPGSRARTSPAAKVDKILEKATDTEILAIIAALQAKLVKPEVDVEGEGGESEEEPFDKTGDAEDYK